jgi:imidazole glycerol-phosphate synthase subunit HisH
VTLIDSPFANVANIARALAASGAIVTTTAEPRAIGEAEKVVLPGVGSFGAAMQWLRATAIDAAIRQAVGRGAPLLGICVGHQLLFDRSAEHAGEGGLGIVRGDVEKLSGCLSTPQIGWNRVSGSGPLFEGVDDDTSFYFVNSYAVRATTAQSASAEYNGRFTAAIQQDGVFGVQFHPEKSSIAGLRVLRNFVRWN